jgi:hypothetical protein
MRAAVYKHNNGGPPAQPRPRIDEGHETEMKPDWELQAANDELTKACHYRECLETNVTVLDNPELRGAQQVSILDAKNAEEAARQKVDRITGRLEKIRELNSKKAEKLKRREAAIDRKKKADTAKLKPEMKPEKIERGRKAGRGMRKKAR